MFKTIDASTYFYYVIPNIMNAVLAIWYKLDSKVMWHAIKQHYLRGGIFLFAIYFCMFSNIFASVIMAVYIGTAMGYDLAENLIKKRYSVLLSETCYGIYYIACLGNHPSI